MNFLLVEEDFFFVVFNLFNYNFVGIDKDGKVLVFLLIGYWEDVNNKIFKDVICGIVYVKKFRFYVVWGFDENIRVSICFFING